MEQRNEMLKQMRLTRRERRGEVQQLISRSFSRRHMSADSPPREISVPVPQAQSLEQRSHSSPGVQAVLDVTKLSDTVSVGDLSVEPRVAGVPRVHLDSSGTEGGDMTTEEVLTPFPSAISQERRDSVSSSDSSCPEEQSVRTPLLEEQLGTVKPPIIPRPSTLHRYDEMFRGGSEEEIPLGGTADTLVTQP